MNEIIKKIRQYAGVSQELLAQSMGVTFATINRWENNRAIPSNIAQSKIYEFCLENDVPLMTFIRERIQKIADSIAVDEGRILLYHGSKSGIIGDIAPSSRRYCDFGSGFYMGTIIDQPLTLVCDFPKAKLYIISLDLRGQYCRDIATDIEWAMLVAYHRGKMNEIKESQLYENYSTFLKNVDIVSGSIADDRMFQVLDDFFMGNITDEALIGSLSALELGRQYVALTDKACSAIRIEEEIELSYLERLCLQEISSQNRKKGIALAQEICRRNRRNGRYFDELLQEGI